MRIVFYLTTLSWASIFADRIEDLCNAMDMEKRWPVVSRNGQQQNFINNLRNTFCKKTRIEARSSRVEFKDDRLALVLHLIQHFGFDSAGLFSPGSGKQLANLAKSFWKTKQLYLGFLSTEKHPMSPLPARMKAANIILDQSRNRLNNLNIANADLRDSVWIIEETDSTLTELQLLPLEVDSTVITFIRNTTNSSSSFNVNEVYKPFSGHSVMTNIIGHWSQNRGLSMTDEPLWERRKDLMGFQFRVAVVPSYFGFRHKEVTDSDGNKVIVPLESRHYDSWHHLSTIMNFTSKFVRTEDGAFGSTQPDGTMNGMIGMIARGEADAAIDGFTVLASRAQWAEPLIPQGVYEGGLMYKKASSSGGGALKWSIYHSPLHPYTWVLAFWAVLFLTAGYTLSMSMSGIHFQEETDAITGLYGLFMQGFPKEPTPISARILFWGLFVVGWLLWTSLSAMLYSFLAVKVDKPPFLNLLGMLKSTDYQLMFLEGDGELEQFKTGNAIEREVFSKRSLIAPDEETFISELKTNPKIVGLRSAYNLRKYTGNSCSYNFIPSWRRVYQWGQYLQKNSSFIKLLNYQLLKMMQNGVILQLNNKYSINFRIMGSQCVDTDGQKGSIDAFGKEEVVSLFVALGIGIVTALILMLLEKFLRKVMCHKNTSQVSRRSSLNTIIISRECPASSSRTIGSEQTTFLN